MKKDIAGRVHLIDEARGLAILLMVVYHTFYNLVVILNIRIDLFYSPLVRFLVVFFGGLFIFISGTAGHFSGNNVKRGIICFCVGMIITAVTLLVLPSSRILFGILHFLGICMMLFPLIKPILYKLPPIISMIATFLLFIVFFNTPNGYIGYEGILKIELPSFLYETPFLFPLGFPNSGFYSSDYFAIIPWIFLYISGGFFGVLVKEKRLPQFFYKMHIRPLAFIGRHTFIIYVLHQPVVFGIMQLIGLIVAA